MNETIVTVNRLLRESYSFLKKNPDLFLVFLLFNISELFFYILFTFPKSNPLFFGLSFFSTLLASVYCYLLTILIWRRDNKEVIEVKKSVKVFLKLLRKLIFPLLFCFILQVILFGFLEYLIGGKILNNERNFGFGFYPAKAVAQLITGLVFTFITFSSIIYPLKNDSFIGSLKMSLAVTSKNLKLVYLIMAVVFVHSFIVTLFIPLGNLYFRLFDVFISTFLVSLVNLMLYFFYVKNYPVDPQEFNKFENSKIVRSVNSNVVFRRIFAAILDLLIWFIIYLMIFVTLDLNHSYLGDLLISDFVWLLLLAVGLGYFLITEWAFQKTLGKRIFGIRVVKLDGSKASFGQILIRNIFRVIDLLPIMVPYLLGLIIIASNDRKQRLGDIVAKTVVSR